MQLYTEAGRELCTALDVALSMGGYEAIVEGFYSIMANHNLHGGQDNTTLAERAIIDWLYPLLIMCPKTIEAVAMLYTVGNERIKLQPHKFPVHKNIERSKYADISKVLNRICRSDITHSFILDEKDL